MPDYAPWSDQTGSRHISQSYEDWMNDMATREPKPIRWTRRTYRQAHSLARFLSGYDCDPAGVAREPLLQRYFELWEDHPQHDDPLTVPTQQRYWRYLDGIPF
jgi:hypothetical protein